jgi:hypothetical protein
MSVLCYEFMSLYDTVAHKHTMLTYNLRYAVEGQYLLGHFYYGTKRQTS